MKFPKHNFIIKSNLILADGSKIKIERKVRNKMDMKQIFKYKSIELSIGFRHSKEKPIGNFSWIKRFSLPVLTGYLINAINLKFKILWFIHKNVYLKGYIDFD